jgi:nicotinate-nucleotide adenylyltransferase
VPPGPGRGAADTVSAPRRIGVFGGTFDPPHYGHLAAAEEAGDRLELARVLFVPTGLPPHKPQAPITPAPLRVRMVELAIADNPRFALSRADVDRPGPSYTADLLAVLRAELGAATKLYFICGMDMLASLPTWHAPERVLAQCYLVAVTRPGTPPVDLAALERALPAARGRVTVLPAPGLDISGRELRARIAQGRTVRYLVPPAVAEFIAARGLYRPA